VGTENAVEAVVEGELLDSDALLANLVDAYHSLFENNEPRVRIVRVLAETGHGKTYAVQRLYDAVAGEACARGKEFYQPGLAPTILPSNDLELRRSRRQVTNLRELVRPAEDRAFAWLAVACSENRDESTDDDLQSLGKQIDYLRRSELQPRGDRALAGAGKVLEGLVEGVLDLEFASIAVKVFGGVAQAISALQRPDVEDFEHFDRDQARDQAERVQSAFRALLDVDRPTIVVIDDAHSASPYLTLALELLLRAATQPSAYEMLDEDTPLLQPRFPLLIVTTEWVHMAELSGGEGQVFRRWVDRLTETQPRIDVSVLYPGQLTKERAVELLAQHRLPADVVDALLEPFDGPLGVNAYTLAIRLSELFELESDLAALEQDAGLRDLVCRQIRATASRSPTDTVKKWFDRLDERAQKAIRLGLQLGRTFPIELVAGGSGEAVAQLQSAVVDHGFLQPGSGFGAPPGTEAHLLRTVTLNDLTYGWLLDRFANSAVGTDPRFTSAVTRFIRSHLEAVATRPVDEFLPIFLLERISRLDPVWSRASRLEHTDPIVQMATDWLVGRVSHKKFMAAINSVDGPDRAALLAAFFVRQRRENLEAYKIPKKYIRNHIKNHVSEARRLGLTAISDGGTRLTTLRLFAARAARREGLTEELREILDLPGWAGFRATFLILHSLADEGKAEEALQLAITAGWSLPAHVLARISELLVQDGRVREAIELLSPDATRNPEVALRLAEYLTGEDRGGEAIEVLRPLGTRSAFVALRLAKLLSGEDRIDEAIDVLRPFSVSDGPVVLRLSGLLALQGRYEEAVMVLLPQAARNTAIALHLSELLVAQRRRADAYEALRPHAARSPEVAMRLAELLMGEDRVREAIDVLGPLSEKNRAVALLLTDLLLRQGRIQDAFVALEPLAVKDEVVAVRLTGLLHHRHRERAIEVLGPHAVRSREAASLFEDLFGTESLQQWHDDFLRRTKGGVRPPRLHELIPMNRERRLLASMQPGEVHKGVVSRIVHFGAFVDLGGVDGLVHISELSWKKFNHPSDIVEVGDEIEVEVLDVDLQRERISLSLKRLQQDPWARFTSEHRLESFVPGKVTKLVPFGAFVEVAEGIEGLVHISELSDQLVEAPEAVVNVGDDVHVRIIDLDDLRRRVSLSLKQRSDAPSKPLTASPGSVAEVVKGDESGGHGRTEPLQDL
jgi:predicted RNA-binding protein with RPS1 domain/thioredoxin-like negative regulator of GroEL